jgi:methanogenic corrinoid protein MtbC1
MMQTSDEDSGSRDCGNLSHGADGASHAPGSGSAAERHACEQASLDALSRQQLGRLLATIETEVVPRLVDAHRRVGNAEALHQFHSHTAPEGAVDHLVALLLRDRVAEAAAWLETLVDDGTSVEAVYLAILQPAARRFGERWEQDTSDFTQVTIALWRLQELMYGLHAAFLDDAIPGVQVRRILLAPAAGSQHTFGMLMVAEFFRRAGWAVWGDPAANEREVAATVREGWFDVVGISLGTVEHLPLATSTVRAVRRASRNPDVVVLLGGPALLRHPELVALAGADTTAADAAEAVEVAERLVPRRAGGAAAN